MKEGDKMKDAAFMLLASAHHATRHSTDDITTQKDPNYRRGQRCKPSKGAETHQDMLHFREAFSNARNASVARGAKSLPIADLAYPEVARMHMQC